MVYKNLFKQKLVSYWLIGNFCLLFFIKKFEDHGGLDVRCGMLIK